MRAKWRGLELPTEVVLDRTTAGPTYGKFIVEPFERGFGITVGNSLRRILLSSLRGSAVSEIKIADAPHEFTSLSGVMEDITDVVLNVKSLIVHLEGDEPKWMKVSKKGPGDVLASDLVPDAAIEILNPDQRLATLTEKVEFSMELRVRSGRGYRAAAGNIEPEQEIGIIPVDSVFSPVTRVRYRTEETRVGQRTDYDRLIMEIWTNGTVSPDLALVEAAKIFRKHLNPFVQYAEEGEEAAADVAAVPEIEQAELKEEIRKKLNMAIEKLELSARAANCMESSKIETVKDLVSMDEAEMLKLRSFGRTSLRELKRKLADMGLELGMEIPEEEPETEENE